MPTYDYRCESNGHIVEVMHRMNDQIATWGELCTKAGIEPGNTPLDTPVTRLATGGNVISHSSKGASEPMSPCAMGNCAGGMCGLG
ncbi:hypothetical protein [Thiorhodospira sibirica]|uniref:hypothetical protein n=1 Tax=Thiorhodospira sibirica TaxID=154347 RepID=UPI00022C4024|nr:hypothetical protein [Thiorhodospira sibirica]